MLKARNIQKHYGNLWVLKGVDVEIDKGEIVSIVGPSGSGKSTLLHILGTLDEPDEGEIQLGERKIHDLKGKELALFRNRHIGFVFQFHHLYPNSLHWKMFAYRPGLQEKRRRKSKRKRSPCFRL